jgi:hypothetical protein
LLAVCRPDVAAEAGATEPAPAGGREADFDPLTVCAEQDPKVCAGPVTFRAVHGSYCKVHDVLLMAFLDESIAQEHANDEEMQLGVLERLREAPRLSEPDGDDLESLKVARDAWSAMDPAQRRARIAKLVNRAISSPWSAYVEARGDLLHAAYVREDVEAFWMLLRLSRGFTQTAGANALHDVIPPDTNVRAKLPRQLTGQKLVIVQRWRAGETDSTIANALGITTRSVRKRIFEARRDFGATVVPRRRMSQSERDAEKLGQ